MRRSHAFGLAIATTLVVTVGCNNGGGKSSKRASATAAVSTSSTSANAPQVTNIAPANGPVDGGTAITITGSNFAKSGAGTTLVLFGTKAVVVTPTSDTEIRVTSPLQTTAGAVDVRVINDIGTGTVTNGFTFDPRTPGVSFTPAVGTYNAIFNYGTKITLDVQGIAVLTTAATVDFGSVRATAVTLVDNDTLIAEVPSGLMPGPTAITVREGSASVTSQGFRVQGQLVYGDLTINEILLDPGSSIDANRDGVKAGGANQSDEFVEIINTTNAAIDLSHVSLKDSGNIEIHKFPNPTSIPAGGSIVVFSGGTIVDFAPRHQSAHAQGSTNGSLLLSNTQNATTPQETLTLEDTAIASLSGPVIVFRVSLSSLGPGFSLNNVNDGQRITNNPATASDYTRHTTVQAGTSSSAGTRANGTPF